MVTPLPFIFFSCIILYTKDVYKQFICSLSHPIVTSSPPFFFFFFFFLHFSFKFQNWGGFNYFQEFVVYLLSLSDIQQVLRNASQDASFSSIIPLVHLIHASTRLLNRLREHHARRPICPEAFWLASREVYRDIENWHKRLSHRENERIVQLESESPPDNPLVVLLIR